MCTTTHLLRPHIAHHLPRFALCGSINTQQLRLVANIVLSGRNIFMNECCVATLKSQSTKMCKIIKS